MDSDRIILAGATGDLGKRIARELVKRGAGVRALVRDGSDPAAIADLRRTGVDIAAVNINDPADMARACAGGSCVVSALSGLRDVILVGQSALLDAAIAAGVPRFIPSDYAIDYTKLAPGSNRNLDLRREFQSRLDDAPIAATSILCGMFMDLLLGQAPFILFKLKRAVYWENAAQPMDFTTKDDVAAFTAAAALDRNTPRFLRIAGDRQSAEGLRAAAGAVSGKEFRLLRAGGLDRLAAL
ncbi:MAG TPA: NmrA family NAD(P)-binding protein, partial [Herpetosiphonaceae bacterium]|nr:NmrA family NAD(P)-binding protein [Herpetosiphonaceae bacterium]